MKKSVFFVTLCILAFSLFSCGNMLEEVDIVIDGLNGAHEALVGTKLYVRLSNGEDAVWSTSDNNIASLSSSYSYYVELKNEGSVTITAKTSASEYHYTLNVLDGIIVADGNAYNIEVGDKLLFSMASKGRAGWSVSDKSKASLSTASGNSTTLTANSVGSVTVNAKTSSNEYNYTIQIQEADGIEIIGLNDGRVMPGDSLTLSMISNAYVKWSVSGAAVAMLSPTNGNKTTLIIKENIKTDDDKTVIVIATKNGRTYEAEITVVVSNVTFINNTDYKVTIRRDSPTVGNVVAEILPDSIWTGYVAPGNNETVFYFNYSKKVIEDSDYGTVWGDMEYNSDSKLSVDSVDLIDMLEIPVPSQKNPKFTKTYLKIYNSSNLVFSLYNGDNTQIRTIRNGLNILPNKCGVYEIDSGGDKLFTSVELEVSNNRIPIEELPAQNGIYECTLYDYTQSLKPVLQN